jgi:chlorophyllide a reductase subunit Y
MDGLPTTSGCHGGRETMQEAARAAGKSESLDRMLADYPRGPHDQPQSMCPAFGSLRVGPAMKRTATILSGSACCVYGLTFTSHFYGARRSVGYVPFNSETLVTGKLFEDIRDAVHATARPEEYDAVVSSISACPPRPACRSTCCRRRSTASAVIGIDVPGFGVPTHAEAKDVLAGAMLRYARLEAEAGPVAAAQPGRGRAHGGADRRTVPGGPAGPRRASGADGARPRSPAALAGMAGPLRLARQRRRRGGAPFYTATVREFRAAGRPSSAPRRSAWTDDGLA